jgi:hypothetical protein
MKQLKVKIWIVVLAYFFFLNIDSVCAMKKKWDRSYSFLKNGSTSKGFDIQSFGIKCNHLEECNNQILLSHFYQNVHDESSLAWNVSSFSTVLNTKYNRFNFNVDQGILNSRDNNAIPTKLVYRFGIKMEQAYLDNDFLYFGIYGGTGQPYAELSFYGGYSRDIGQVGRGLGEVYAMIFGEDKVYISFAASLTKVISNHHLTVKPYYSKTRYDKLNLILSDQIFFKNDTNYLIFKLVSGYYPDSHTFINYTTINNGRYRFSCEGLFDLPKYQATLLPLIGCEYVKDFNDDFRTSWHVQFGIRYTLKVKNIAQKNK